MKQTSGSKRVRSNPELVPPVSLLSAAAVREMQIDWVYAPA